MLSPKKRFRHTSAVALAVAFEEAVTFPAAAPSPEVSAASGVGGESSSCKASFLITLLPEVALASTPSFGSATPP